MGTNKEHIEQLEVGLGEVQDGLHRMELGMADRLRHLEETLNRLSDVLQTMATNTVKATMGDDLLSPPRQRSLNFLDSQEMIRRSGEANQWWQGSVGHSKRKDALFCGQILKTNFELFLGLRSVKILIKLFRESYRQALFVITSKNLNAWAIGMFKPQSLKDAINLAQMRDDQLTHQWEFLQPPPPARAPLALPPSSSCSSCSTC
ncbi:hypothetical protein Pint_28246 [Pistacia integerrima]|uniref:Uncharacterized protein n=1 Tax=Pistacia integerrima TaxID=434235 RepID=A0ACC0YU25_9ROSI|nr:hypothetical protein Pint_28246 [Pistacia integerrima]